MLDQQQQQQQRDASAGAEMQARGVQCAIHTQRKDGRDRRAGTAVAGTKHAKSAQHEREALLAERECEAQIRWPSCKMRDNWSVSRGDKTQRQTRCTINTCAASDHRREGTRRTLYAVLKTTKKT